MTPPLLVSLSDYGGDWDRYETALHEIFMQEIVRGRLTLDGCRISCRRIPETGGRWASFWHLIQEGRIEDERTPDLRRCERLRWVRWVIENAETHPEISRWENTRKTEVNVLLWYRGEYLVVLSRRNEYLLLKTAYCTKHSGRIAALRREHDEFIQRCNAAAPNS
jgi:hypothetical protein